jgi:phenylacetate-CoA ligase
VAAQEQIDVANSAVRAIVVAGEPGGSIAAVRERIETAWDAKVYDHCGASEIGAWAYPDAERRGVHIIESEFIAEFISVESGQPASEGELAELVLTNLGRYGSPVVRYRTGDLVRPCWSNGGANRFVLLDGGVLGRTDDMMIIRGVNVYPTAVEQILRSFPEVVEYRMTALKVAEMDQLSIEVEDRLGAPRRVADELRLRLGLRIEVQSVPIGSLPRFEGKGCRFVDSR